MTTTTRPPRLKRRAAAARVDARFSLISTILILPFEMETIFSQRGMTLAPPDQPCATSWVTRSRSASAVREPTHDATSRKHDHFVSDRQRLLQVVHDQDDRLPRVSRAPDLIEHLLGLADGERRGRLVEDQAARPVNDGAGDRDSLFLAAGQRRGRIAQAPSQINAERGQRVRL